MYLFTGGDLALRGWPDCAADVAEGSGSWQLLHPLPHCTRRPPGHCVPGSLLSYRVADPWTGYDIGTLKGRLLQYWSAYCSDKWEISPRCFWHGPTGYCKQKNKKHKDMQVLNLGWIAYPSLLTSTLHRCEACTMKSHQRGLQVWRGSNNQQWKGFGTLCSSLLFDCFQSVLERLGHAGPRLGRPLTWMGGYPLISWALVSVLDENVALSLFAFFSMGFRRKRELWPGLLTHYTLPPPHQKKSKFYTRNTKTLHYSHPDSASQYLVHTHTRAGICVFCIKWLSLHVHALFAFWQNLMLWSPKEIGKWLRVEGI